MSFKSVDEIDKFRFDDCVICAFEVSKGELAMELEALIVKVNNSQNTNFTESYAGTTRAGFTSCTIKEIIKDGYKYYDANDVLLSEVPDSVLNVMEADELIKKIPGAYLYAIEPCNDDDVAEFETKAGTENATENKSIKKSCALCLEFVDETDNTMAESYRIFIEYEVATFEWERYMNRVQN